VTTHSFLEECLALIKTEIAPRLRGYLAVFNFADTKRRNDHLGHDKIDQDIQNFTELLEKVIGANGYSQRIGGARWLGFFGIASCDAIATLLDAFYQEEAFLYGWKSSGVREGIKKGTAMTVETKIIRAMRCVYTQIETLGDFDVLVGQLLENDYGLPVSIPHQLQDICAQPMQRWQCVLEYPQSPHCPFCESTKFNWLDGDASIYGGYGICQTCGAEVEISAVF
jgi:hypothetical protein